MPNSTYFLSLSPFSGRCFAFIHRRIAQAEAHGKMRVIGSMITLAAGLSVCQMASAFVAPAASIR